MIRIVIADDNAGIRFSIARLLNKQVNMSVIGQAENGFRALELLKSYPADILVLDIEMPIMTGVEVAQHLHTQESGPKVIVLSNYADREFVENLLDLGVCGYMVKEDAPDHLAEAVRQIYKDGKRWLSAAVQSYGRFNQTVL